MLTKEQLQKFENQFLDIGDERKILHTQGIPSTSVFDDPKVAEVSTQKELEHILDSTLQEALAPSIDNSETAPPIDSPADIPIDSLIDNIETNQDTSNITTEITQETESISEASLEIQDSTTDDLPPTNFTPDVIEEPADMDNFELPQHFTAMPDTDSIPFLQQDTSLEDLAVDSTQDIAHTLEQGEPQEPRNISVEDSLENLFNEVSAIDNTDDSEDDTSQYSSAELVALYDSTGKQYKQQTQYKIRRELHAQDEIKFLENLTTLSIYIQNAVKEILKNPEFEDRQEYLVDLIFDNAPEYIIHKECEKILKIPINLILNKNIFSDFNALQVAITPILDKTKKTLRVVIFKIIPIAALIVLSVFYSIFFVIQPLHATYWYEKGIDELTENNIIDSENYFKKAASIFILPKYYFKYADIYLDQRNFILAKEKYEQLIFGTNNIIKEYMQSETEQNNFFSSIQVKNKSYSIINTVNFHRKAFDTLVSLEATINQNFSIGNTYYNLWLTKFPNDQITIQALANHYIAWYDTENTPFLLDQAQYFYGKLILLTEYQNESLILKLQWATRAHDNQYIDFILNGIFEDTTQLSSKLTDDTFTPLVETASYQLLQNKITNIENLLNLLNDSDTEIIDLPYLYALYYEKTQQPLLIKSNLEAALYTYSHAPTLTKQQYKNYIDTYIKLSEISISYDENIILAYQYINDAQALFEKVEKLFNNNNIHYLTRLYFIRSQIELAQGNAEKSKHYLTAAIQKDYSSLALTYHQGLLHYLNSDWQQAATQFISLTSYIQKDTHVKTQIAIFSSAGNASFYQGNYVAASVYYKKALELLHTHNYLEHNIITVRLDKNIHIKERYETIAQVKNNLGVALYYAAHKSIDSAQLEQQAFVTLQESNTLFQNLNRNRNFVRSVKKDLPFINMTAILDNKFDAPLEIYSEVIYTIPTQSLFNPEKLIAIND